MQVTKRECPFCGSNEKQIALTMEAHSFCEPNFAYIDDPYTLLNITRSTRFSFAKCRICGFMFSEDLLDDDSLNKVYDEIINPAICKDYSLSEKVFEFNRKDFNHTMELLPDKTKVKRALDYGAGWGTWAMIAREQIQEVHCYETSPIRKKYILEAGLSLIESESSILSTDKFQLINCQEVLEHVPNPKDVLKVLRDALTDDGAIWLTVPCCTADYYKFQAEAISKGQNSKEINPWEHLNYFTNKTLQDMCKAVGLVPHSDYLNENQNLETTKCIFVKEAKSSENLSRSTPLTNVSGNPGELTWIQRLRQILRF